MIVEGRDKVRDLRSETSGPPLEQRIGNLIETLAQEGAGRITLTVEGTPRPLSRRAAEEASAIAEEALRTQGQLSRTAVTGGAAIAAERTILETWRDYYVTALSKVPDLAIAPGSFDGAIRAAQERVRRAANASLSALEK